LQNRSAVAVASFVSFCIQHNITQPPDKIVKNLCTFLCQDVEQTPTFAYSRKMTEGILSFQSSTAPSSTKASKDANGDVDRPDAEKGQELRKARLARRGACQAFEQLSAKFGDRLLEVIPNMWPSMAGGLLSAFKSSTHVLFFIWVYAHSCLDSSQAPDTLIEKQFGQDVIDSLSVLEAVVPTFHEGLRPMLQDLFPMMELALLSRFAIVRQAAARCFAIICDVMTPEAMRYVVEKVIPFLQDPLVLTNRQGTIELIYRLFFYC